MRSALFTEKKASTETVVSWPKVTQLLAGFPSASAASLHVEDMTVFHLIPGVGP